MVTLASVLENLDLVEVLVTFLAPGDVFRLASGFIININTLIYTQYSVKSPTNVMS